MAASLIRHPGLELPVYNGSEEDIAWTKHQRWNAQAFTSNGEDGSKLLRGALISATIGASSLKKLLTINKDVLGAFANDCGAQVIGHNWGLYHVKGTDENSLAHLVARAQERTVGGHNLLPANHLLIAEVDVIDPFDKQPAGSTISRLQPPTDEQATAILASTAKFAAQQPRWTDAHPSQFAHGTIQQASESGLWLVDIEPRLE